MIVYLPDFASLPVHHFCLAVIMISKNYDDVLMFVPDVIPCYTLVPTDRIPSHPLFFRGVSLPGGPASVGLQIAASAKVCWIA